MIIYSMQVMILKEVNVLVSSLLSFDPVSRKKFNPAPSNYESRVLFNRPCSIEKLLQNFLATLVVLLSHKIHLTYSTCCCWLPRQTYDTLIAWWTVKQIFNQSIDVRRRFKSNNFYLVLISLQFICSLPLQSFSQLFYVTLYSTCKILQSRNESRTSY